VANGVPGTSLPVRPLPAPDIPGTMSKPKGTPGKHRDRPSSWPRWRVPGKEGNSLGPWSGRGGDYRCDLQHGTLFTPETAKLKQDDKTAID
jgi:hypothetical protein